MCVFVFVYLQLHSVAGVHSHSVGAVQERAVRQRGVIRGVYVSLWVREIHHAARQSCGDSRAVYIALALLFLFSALLCNPFNVTLLGNSLEIPAVYN